MTPEQFIPFWNALTTRDRKLIEDNLQTAANPGSGFFSSKRFMRGGIIFLLNGHLRIFLSSDEGREITAMSMEAGENFLVHPGDASHNRKGHVISRELKKMEEFGLIKLGRGEIEILYRDGLRELSE